jgi:hypothetical protein
MSKSNVKTYILVMLSIFLLWRILTVNLTQYAETLKPEDNSILRKNSTNARFEEAVRLAATDSRLGYNLANKLFWENPLDGRSLVLVGLLMERDGKIKQSNHLMQIIARLYANQPETQMQLGGYWARQSNIKLAIEAWGRAMEMQPSLRKGLFPDLLNVVEQPKYYKQVQQSFANSDKWGAEFFVYAAQNAAFPDTLKVLYQARAAGKIPPSAEMLSAYLTTLIHDAFWTDAYFVWLNSLSDGQLNALGNVYDGGFEYAAPEEGFAWRFAKGSGVAVEPQKTHGANGSKALHISFKGLRSINTVLAQQILLLDAGSYQLHGRIKLDHLAAVNGVHWELLCLGNERNLVARSDDIIDKSVWRQFNFTFDLSADCAAQELRLVVDAADAARPNMLGSLWFDDLAIRQLSVR